jgi:hypothetical protein
MPRYVVERSFPNGFGFAPTVEGAERCREVVERNTDEAVTWIHTYVSDDDKTAFCVYDAPSPEAIRRAATKNELPVDRITQVRVLDPFFSG